LGQRHHFLGARIIAAEIADDLEAALEQFTKIAARLAPPGAREPVNRALQWAAAKVAASPHPRARRR
jgi:hypothetical protein